MGHTLIISQKKNASHERPQHIARRVRLLPGVTACLLIMSLLIAPSARIFASEPVVDDAPREPLAMPEAEMNDDTAESDVIEGDETPPIEAVGTEDPADEESPTEIVSTDASTTEPTDSTEATSTTTAKQEETTTTATTTPPVVSVSSSTPHVAGTTTVVTAPTATSTKHDANGTHTGTTTAPAATTTPEAVDTTDNEGVATEEGEQHATTTPHTASDEEIEEVAVDTEATTTPMGPDMPAVSTLTNNENRFSFGENECVAVGDGSFYCFEKIATVPHLEDQVRAELDGGGDKEIYLYEDGERTRITDNAYDDDAPFYDPVTGRIVWHAMIADRFQIFTYENDKVVQLTDTSYNNMEPTTYDDVIVWQAWIGNDWEVAMAEDGEVTILTDNETHDVAPHVRDNYILWQAAEGNQWYVKVYDRTTGAVETIEGGAGASLENPRFVLVYDAKKENGDIETLGYDLKQKRVIPLASTPAPLPQDLPEPEHTGEKEALVQTQTSLKTEQEADQQSGGDGGDGDDGGAADATGDLIIPDVGTTTNGVQAS